MNWYFEAFRKYAVFSGRARRKEFWMFGLFNALASITIAIFENLVGIADPDTGYGFLGGLYILATVVPAILLSVRRLHDTGRSGWWFSITFVPLIGSIMFLIFVASDSQPGTNAYGPSPKMEA